MNITIKEYPYVDEENNWLYLDVELIVVNEPVKTRWAGRTKQYYLDIGYTCENWHEPFYVDVQHLTTGSHVKVLAICPTCGEQREAKFQDIILSKHSKCHGCTMKINLIGRFFGRLLIVEGLDTDSHGNSKWLCRCECGNTTEVMGGHLTSGATKSCGCLNAQLAHERMAGENNHQYNHDLTDEQRNSFRNTTKWKTEVKNRDNHICQCCGDYDGDIVVHHLNNYSDYPEQRTDLDNGVTLCVDCHNKFHNKYMGNNRISCTSDDFIDFCNDMFPQAIFLDRIISTQIE